MQNWDRGKPRRLRSAWNFVFRLPLPLETETTLFILVSALDVFMTYLLLQYGGFVEANPVARYFLSGWQFRGIVYFKFALVAVVVLIAQGIARQNFTAARRLLIFATLVVSAVVFYSLMLFFRAMGLL